MTSTRRTAVVTGALFLITHVTSVAGLALYQPVLRDPDPVAGAAAGTPVLLGALLEVVLAVAIVGTAVALHPVVKRHGEGLAMGYVGLRTLEAGIIAVGVVPLLVVSTLGRDLPDTAGIAPLGNALVAFHNGTFLLGPGFVCGGNTAVLAYLLYRSRLVPRFIPVLGLVGGPLVFASSAAQLLGLYPQFSTWAAVPAVPVFAWEICLALCLIGRGFREPSAAGLPPSPVRAGGHPVAV